MSSEPLENPGFRLQVAESDAVEPTPAGLGLEPQRVPQEHQNVEEGSIQAASEVALQSTQAGLGHESSSFQDVERGAIQVNSGVAVDSIHVGLGLESPSFQEQLNVEEGAVQANSGVSVVGLGLKSPSFQEQLNVKEGAVQAISGVAVQPTQAGLKLESHDFQEQPNVEGRSIWANSGIAVHPTQAAFPNLSDLEGMSMDDFHDLLHPSVDERALLEEILQHATGQVEASYQEEEESGMNDLEEPIDGEEDHGIPAQTESQKMENHEEDTGIQAWTGSQQMQEGPPQQGTAGRRMRLQVLLGGVKGPSEPKCVSIGGMSLAQEAGSTCSLSHAFTSNQSILNVTCQQSPAEFLPNLLHGDAACSSSRATMCEEGDTKRPLCTEGLVSCVIKSDHPDVTQQTPQDVSGYSTPRLLSLTSLVHVLRLLGDACVMPAFATELKIEMEEMNFGSEDNFNGSGCSETELEGRQSIASHLNSRGRCQVTQERPYVQQRKTPSNSGKANVKYRGAMIRGKDILVLASQHEECQKPCTHIGTGLSACLCWITTLALILLCLFRSFCRLTRTAFNFV